MDFEWDEPKRKANALKHQLDFRDAIGMWAGSTLDPAAVRQHGEEVRYLALGSIGADETVIAVVYTFRGHTRRIISARRARRNEREHYKSVFGRGR